MKKFLRKKQKTRIHRNPEESWTGTKNEKQGPRNDIPETGKCNRGHGVAPRRPYHGLWWTYALDPAHRRDPDIMGRGRAYIDHSRSKFTLTVSEGSA